jgi:hypothetical protein
VIGIVLAVALAVTSAPPAMGASAARHRPAGALPPPAAMLAHYALALAAQRTPALLSFEYSIDQSGAHDIEQTHRVFRSGNSERDELLSVDGKRLEPPSIHIFFGHRNRYAIEALAPRPEAYIFRYVGSVRDGRHADAVFATKPRNPSDSTVAQVTLDGITALPVAIRFLTRAHAGSGTVTYGRIGKYWMPTAAAATAHIGKTVAVEHLVFSRYRFPTALAPWTFATPRPLPSFPPPRAL